MKNWNYIEGTKVGNIKDDKKAQQLWDEMQHAKKLAEDWAREIHRTGKEEYKGSQKDAEEAYRKAKREYEKYAMNAKTGNALKYTNLEEAKKMCRQINDSLAPDAALRHYRHVYEKDGAYYVMETGEGTAKGMKRVGNDTPAEYFSKKPKVIGNEFNHLDYLEALLTGKWTQEQIEYVLKNPQLFKKEVIEAAKKEKGKRTGNEKTGAEGFFKQLSDDVKEREKKDDKEIRKVGNYVPNYRYKDFLITNPEGYEFIVFLKDGRTVGYRGTTSKAQAEDWCDWHDAKTGKPITNSKTGNALNWDENLVGKFVWVKDKGQEWKVYVMQDKGDKVYIRDDDGSQGWVSKTRITGKVGNSIGGGVQSETVLTEAKDGSQYWVEKTSKSGQYAQYNLYYTIGQGKRHAGVFKDKEAAADAGRRIIGNKIQVRPGFTKEEEFFIRYPGANSREHLLKLIELAKKEGLSKEFIEDMEHDLKSWKVKNSSSNEEYWKKLAREDEEFKKRFEKEYGVKAKNEASDDKFAYVMREFDEGKLKTPDGKVVTDPAQAKAIAYSESKKTENGLARARNAIKKS